MKKIIILLLAFAAVNCNAQFWSFETSGTTENGNTVQAYGELSLLDNVVTGWVFNSSDVPSSLLGLWVQSDTIDVVTDLFVSEPWDFQTIVPVYMKNLVDGEDLDKYFGFELDHSVNGWEPALTQGQTFVFSFTTNELFVDEDNGLHDMLFRWQQVGEDFEDSAKTFATIFEGGSPAVPEPSIVGLMAAIGVVGLVLIRKKFKK